MNQLEAKLQEIEKLANSATPAPWILERMHAMGETWTRIHNENKTKEILSMEGDLQDVKPVCADAVFIATSRTLVPQLVKALRLAIEQRTDCYLISDEFRHEFKLKDMNSELAAIFEGRSE